MQRANHILLTLVLALVAFAATVLPASNARAADYGPGFDVGLGRIGAYITPSGVQAYCLEIDKDRPLGVTDDGTVGGWGSLSPDELTRLNWVLHTYGQSSDPIVTSAVNLYVWSVGDPVTYGSHGVSGDEYYSGRAGEARAAVLETLAEIRAAVAAAPPRGSVSIELAPDLTGQVVVSDPGHRGAVLTLDGTDDPGPFDVEDGSVVEFTAEPEPGDRVATVTATAVFTARTYPPTITVYDSGAPAQHVAGPSGDALTASATAETPLEFHPVLASAVDDAQLATGDPALDRLAVGVSDDSPAPWRPGTTVVARGTLYGPFPAAPAEATEPPADAPVAWSETIEFDGTGDFVSSGEYAPTEPGHYTWVWSIESADQPRTTPVPVDYRWSDRFGIPAESFQVVQPLPRTGADEDGAGLLVGLGLLALGAGLVIAAAVLRVRVRSIVPPSLRATLPRRRRAAAP